jgi:hypothetical protein
MAAVRQQSHGSLTVTGSKRGHVTTRAWVTIRVTIRSAEALAFRRGQFIIAICTVGGFNSKPRIENRISSVAERQARRKRGKAIYLGVGMPATKKVFNIHYDGPK